MCVRLRRAFRRVSIGPKDDSLGHVLRVKFGSSFHPDWDDGPKAQATIEREILISMAGMSAEHRYVGRRNWRGGRSDIKIACDLAGYL